MTVPTRQTSFFSSSFYIFVHRKMIIVTLFFGYNSYIMARLIPRQEFKTQKLLTKNVDSKNDHLVIKANKNDDEYHVKIDDVVEIQQHLKVNKIEAVDKDCVEFENIKINGLNSGENKVLTVDENKNVVLTEIVTHQHENMSILNNLSND